MIDFNSVFYKKAKKLLDDFVAKGGKVENLSRADEIYRYIKNSKIHDKNGNFIDLETKFELLGYPRESKRSTDLRGDLIGEIQDYLDNGGSFHIERKKLPFYERLNTYTKSLARHGEYLTHEEIMKYDLGFKQYSELYYRCKSLESMDEYEDENGFVDSYHQNNRFSSYITDLAISLNIPYYLIITLITDKKLKHYDLSLDKIKNIEIRLKNYAIRNGSFVGIKRTDPKLYNDFEYIARYYSDGSGQRFSKSDWLFIFGLRDVEHRFKNVKPLEVDITDIMTDLKQKYKNEIVKMKDIDNDSYRKIIKEAVTRGVTISKIFNEYGLKCNGINMPRLSKVQLEEIPYFQEMIERRDELISKKLKPNLCIEEIFELKVKAVQQVYEEYREKLENYLPEEVEKIETGLSV